MPKSTNRTGRVSSIDYEHGTYEVTYFDRGQSVTKKINAISNGEYKMPKIGQIVSVSHNSNGTAAATTFGTVWNESNKPPEGYEGLWRKDFSNEKGQAYARYDANTGEYRLHIDGKLVLEIGGGTTVEISGGAVKITTPSMSVQASAGDIVIGGISHTGHTHMGVHGGTSGPR